MLDEYFSVFHGITDAWLCCLRLMIKSASGHCRGGTAVNLPCAAVIVRSSSYDPEAGLYHCTMISPAPGKCSERSISAALLSGK
jgi:hypothetical protein